jgi:N-methylhydantoinase A
MILGIDVGGTHTDAVLIAHNKVLKKAKVPTDSTNLFSSLLAITNELADAASAEELERIVLSTTLSTNAIVQNKIDRVGIMLVSGPGLPASAYEHYPQVSFLSGYVNHRGIEISAVNPEEAANALHRFYANGIRNVGVVGKFSTRNPKQELEIQKIIQGPLDHVSLGHTMSGHLNFPRRIATTYLNECVWRLHHIFIREILHFARTRGIKVPIYLLKADGGTFDILKSVESPIETILSGPAASVMGILTATRCSTDAIALDIGGTTTDIAAFADGVPLFEPFGVTIEGYKTLIRGIRSRSVGVGGDSVVRVKDGLLTIGPDREGPAAALGGPCPTPTDAMVALGLTDIGNAEKAVASLRPLADALHWAIDETAHTILRDTCTLIAGLVRKTIDEINNQPVYTVHEMLEGKQIKPQHLYVVGGPSGVLGPALGKLLGCRVHVPAHAEVSNAIGAAMARTTAELTLVADTEQKLLTICEDGLRTPISSRFTMEDAIRIGTEKLRAKVLKMGAAEDELEIEVVESQEFNMVRDCYTVGKNIRVKLQIKPGCTANLDQEVVICE